MNSIRVGKDKVMSDRICFPYEDEEYNLPEFVKDMGEIYDRMSDDLSKEILTSRILLCLTEDYCYMANVIMHTQGGKKLNQVIKDRKGKPQFIYGRSEEHTSELQSPS